MYTPECVDYVENVAFMTLRPVSYVKDISVIGAFLILIESALNVKNEWTRSAVNF